MTRQDSDDRDHTHDCCTARAVACMIVEASTSTAVRNLGALSACDAGACRRRAGEVNENAAVVAEEAYQFDISAATTASRDTVKEAFRNALDGYSGTVGAVVVQSITLTPPIDDITGLEAGRQDGTYRSTFEARVFYERAEPTL